MLREYPKAIADFDMVIRLNPKDSDSYKHLSIAKEQLAAGAERDFIRAQTLELKQEFEESLQRFRNQRS